MFFSLIQCKCNHSTYGTPRVRVAFGFVDRISIIDKGIMHFAKASVTSTEQVHGLTMIFFGWTFFGLFQELDCCVESCCTFSQGFNTERLKKVQNLNFLLLWSLRKKLFVYFSTIFFECWQSLGPLGSGGSLTKIDFL